ncbi:hypothetical protein [Mediterraneibacter agrestimuris]|uniref:hypothetical protein n=1 Tax=Mediterraneibacter agrestimuris TaxID=2941333 RepID=UPI00203E6E8B|nr:hypothetical protein [Mediterraneibacter agrestimuris]
MRNKKLRAAVIMAMVCMMFGGCSRFDAGVYTQAVLDASYKNQTESYIELTETTKEDAEAFFQKRLNATMEEFKSEKLSEELEGDYKSLFEQVMKQVKYTVGESKKEEDDSYTVNVSVEPVTLFDDTYQSFQKKAEEYAESVTERVMNGDEMPTDEEIQEEVYKLYYEILKEEMDAGMKYGAARELTLHIMRTEDGNYEINSEDLQVLEENLISRKVMAEGA